MSPVEHLKLMGDFNGRPIDRRLAMRGVDPIRAVIGQDVLRQRQAVIDYGAAALYLKEIPA